LNYYIIPGIVRKTPIKMEHILDAVCEVCNTSMAVLKKRNRKRELVMARHFICYFLRKETGLSLKSIGNLFGHDHTTVIHGVNTITNLLCVEDPYIMEYHRLITKKV
jgi:chromosomal replication initiator protein